VACFLGLAVPGLIFFGVEGFVAGRIATSVAMLAVRRFYLRRLFGATELLTLGLRGGAPVALAAVATLALRDVVDPGTLPELATFLAVAGTLTWLSDRGLLRELVAYARGRGPLVAATEPLASGPA